MGHDVGDDLLDRSAVRATLPGLDLVEGSGETDAPKTVRLLGQRSAKARSPHGCAFGTDVSLP
jgi:hypothetical protein